MSTNIRECFDKLVREHPSLQNGDYNGIVPEDCENETDLYARLLVRAVGKQLKTGLHREYIRKKEDLTVMHGTMDIRGTVKNRLDRKYLISCESDVLSENNAFNGILKATMLFLLRRNEVNPDVRAVLKKQILAFSEIEAADLGHVDWKRLMSRRSGADLIMMAQICRLISEWQNGETE
ncbi:MAG: hypothetical protein K6E85_04050 [Lachnospiraceae bacterium]|nr:hypothetical protein [Lachnospiraceae bacterium]